MVIGIDAYGDGVPPLQNAVRDALAVGHALGTAHGFDVQGLFDRQATNSGITALLDNTLPASIESDDRLIVYVAGHGVSRPSVDGPAGYLLFQDAVRGDPATFFPMRALHDGLARLSCRHLLVILDCCFAGTFRWASLRDAVTPERVFQETFDRFVMSPAWQVLTSAASDQRALDTLGDRDGTRASHSPFTDALLDGLSKSADLDGDGLITATELYLYVRNRLETATATHATLQTPGLFPLRKHERGGVRISDPRTAATARSCATPHRRVQPVPSA